MARFFYSLVLYLLSPLIVFYVYILRGRKNSAYRDHFMERFGFINANLSTNPPVMIHCASVGEVLAASPLIKKLQQQLPNTPLLITCNTPTGREQIKNNFNSSVHLSYLPMDFPCATARFLKRTKPAMLCILETELWPNLMAQCKQQGIPVLVLNARLSEKSLQGYQKVAPLSKAIMDSITALASHNQDDANRFIKLGLNAEYIHITGSIKFDISPTIEQLDKVKHLKKQYNNQRFIWVAGSTHPIEHALILNAHKQLLKHSPDALLVIAPRHPEQFDKVATLLEDSALSFSRRSNNDYQGEHVLLADTLGELQCLYGMADISYIGGSLIERGGHNPLESAAFSVGALTGPHTYNFNHVYPELIALGGAKKITSTEELSQQLITLCQQPLLCIQLGERAAQCVANNQGAIAKTTAIINEHLEPRND
ncbi:3-deoxy-D-manno-octulosonic acid transferase [Pseudoalteromonas sp. NEC-BIFX-2020_002]|uniref:lipid IV(A) 3-deoxy-D-manno-octulosonic acid transferase n=1 Tax=Pseudoalteromonas sp. NEC-BIFX-2020_002 TaxID=2732353 RepID=UPI001477250B|nr:lipid IV(A) 3-deoxy-D-manno-octulosonic acid transferase [Pseudoalteromonas sp. NEC-BIFX-2020_002]NNG42160.1 3-deoxy-D-manno-octulosonic acid transferase [Pseudoalteromonas sp. NEC-BIFX-2020_002]